MDNAIQYPIIGTKKKYIWIRITIHHKIHTIKAKSIECLFNLFVCWTFFDLSNTNLYRLLINLVPSELKISVLSCFDYSKIITTTCVNSHSLKLQLVFNYFICFIDMLNNKQLLYCTNMKIFLTENLWKSLVFTLYTFSEKKRKPNLCDSSRCT